MTSYTSFGGSGYQVISEAVAEAFPESGLDIPLLWPTVIEQILVSEVQHMLIAEQLQISPDDAPQVLRESSEFGRLFHSDPTPMSPRENSSHSPRPRTSFPPMSPLANIPDLPPPHFTMIAIKSEPVEEAVDPTTLCSFCDEPLPLTPSAKLVALREDLEAKSTPFPLPDNPGHRQTHVTNFVACCELHRVERNIFDSNHPQLALLPRFHKPFQSYNGSQARLDRRL
jgi:hypothetical protein